MFDDFDTGALTPAINRGLFIAGILATGAAFIWHAVCQLWG